MDQSEVIEIFQRNVKSRPRIVRMRDLMRWYRLRTKGGQAVSIAEQLVEAGLLVRVKTGAGLKSEYQVVE